MLVRSMELTSLFQVLLLVFSIEGKSISSIARNIATASTGTPVLHFASCSKGRRFPHPETPSKYFECQFISKADVWLTQPLNCLPGEIFDGLKQMCIEKKFSEEESHNRVEVEARFDVATAARNEDIHEKRADTSSSTTTTDNNKSTNSSKDSFGLLIKLASSIDNLSSSVQTLVKTNEKLVGFKVEGSMDKMKPNEKITGSVDMTGQLKEQKHNTKIHSQGHNELVHKSEDESTTSEPHKNATAVDKIAESENNEGSNESGNTFFKISDLLKNMLPKPIVSAIPTIPSPLRRNDNDALTTVAPTQNFSLYNRDHNGPQWIRNVTRPASNQLLQAYEYHHLPRPTTVRPDYLDPFKSHQSMNNILNLMSLFRFLSGRRAGIQEDYDSNNENSSQDHKNSGSNSTGEFAHAAAAFANPHSNPQRVIHSSNGNNKSNWNVDSNPFVFQRIPVSPALHNWKVLQNNPRLTNIESSNEGFFTSNVREPRKL